MNEQYEAVDTKDRIGEKDYIVERSPRALPSQPNTGMAQRTFVWWKTHHQEATNLAVLLSVILTLVGVVYAYYQLKTSATNFQKEYAEQQRSTAVTLVSEFFNQVGDVEIAMASDANYSRDDYSDLQLMNLIVSRAQLLLEELESGKQRGSVVRFLATNNYGHLFQPNFGDSESKRINLYRIDFSGVSLSDAILDGTLLECVAMRNSTLFNVDLSKSTIRNTDMTGSKIANTNFKNARIYSSSLRDAHLITSSDFKGAVIENSDLSGMYVKDALVEHIIGEKTFSYDMSQQQKSQYALAEILSGVESLAGSKIDNQTAKALYTIVGVSRFREILPSRTFDANAWAFVLDEDNLNCNT